MRKPSYLMKATRTRNNKIKQRVRHLRQHWGDEQCWLALREIAKEVYLEERSRRSDLINPTKR